jgi:hypothetical protein
MWSLWFVVPRINIPRLQQCSFRIIGRSNFLARISQCAVEGALFPAGANPARQLSLQPEASEAVQGGNELD